jgi:hypothetical protein
MTPPSGDESDRRSAGESPDCPNITTCDLCGEDALKSTPDGPERQVTLQSGEKRIDALFCDACFSRLYGELAMGPELRAKIRGDGA